MTRDIPICRDCVVLDHKTHNCVTPSDARVQMEATLNELMSLCKKNIKDKKSEKDRLDFIISKLEDEQSHFEQKLEKETHSIIRRIMDSKTTVQKEYDQKKKAEKVTVNQQKRI